MTQFSDYLALGPVPVRRPWQATNIAPAPEAFGVVGVGRTYGFELVPAQLAALATTASVGTAGGAITLAANGSSITAATLPNGSSWYLLDSERCISLVSTATLAATTFTLTGYDYYGQLLTATATGPTNGTVTFSKPVRAVASVSAGGTANPITVQTADVFGLPIVLADRGFLQQAYFNGTSCQTVTTADSTSPATGATGPVRGTITTGTAGTANGTRRLIVSILASDAQIAPSASTNGSSVYGVTQV